MKNYRSNNLTKTSNPNRERGFTLVEVLVAISILCFGLLGVAVMQTSSIRGNALASDMTEGTVWASEYLESLMRIASTNYNDPSFLLDTNNNGDAGVDDTGANADYQQTEGRYLISWNISVDSALTNTKTVKVIVSWNGQFGTKRVSIQHIIPKV